MTQTIGALVRACHPGPTAVVAALAVALSLGVGQTVPGTVLVGLTVLVGQLSIGWSNDWLDAGRDSQSRRGNKPVATGQIVVQRVQGAAFAALLLSFPLSFLNGYAAGWAHLGLVGSGWAYNLWFKRTLLSWLPYVVGFALLPAFITLSLSEPQWPPWWAMAAGSLLGVGAHFANVVPDIERDLAQGVLGLPQRLGRAGASAVALALLVLASGLLVFAPGGSPNLLMSLGLLVTVALCGWAGFSLASGRDGSAVFRSALLIALVDVLLFVAGGTSFVG